MCDLKIEENTNHLFSRKEGHTIQHIQYSNWFRCGVKGEEICREKNVNIEDFITVG